MDVDTKCGNDTSRPTCHESSGLFAVIIVPALPAVSTVVVVALIFCSLHKSKQRGRSSSAHLSHRDNCADQHGVSVTMTPVKTAKVEQASFPRGVRS